MKTSLAFFLLTGALAYGQGAPASRLETSPRHREWVKVKSGQREVSCFITYPEAKDKAPAVLVIHEIFGLSDWVRGVTDQLAEHGPCRVRDLAEQTPRQGVDPARQRERCYHVDRHDLRGDDPVQGLNHDPGEPPQAEPEPDMADVLERVP